MNILKNNMRFWSLLTILFLVVTGLSFSKVLASEGDPHVNYAVHVENQGWLDPVQDGESAGTTGEALRQEAVKINIVDDNGNPYEGLGVSYRSHVQDIGWQNYVTDGAESGTTGQAKKVEAIQVNLTGPESNEFSVSYRTHVENFGWTDWASDGEPSGSEGYNYRLESIEIKIIPASSNNLEYAENSFYSKYGLGDLRYQSHVQDIGWQNCVNNDETSGTIGNNKQIEAFRISPNPNLPEGDILVSTHVQDIGWQDYTSSYHTAGTVGQNKRVEAIRIKLTGNLASQYDIQYQVHVQDIGWMDPVKNDEVAGTTGQSKQVEAIIVSLIDKRLSQAENEPITLNSNKIGIEKGDNGECVLTSTSTNASNSIAVLDENNNTVKNLNDNGIDGDDNPGDGVFSGIINISTNDLGCFKYHAYDGKDSSSTLSIFVIDSTSPSENDKAQNIGDTINSINNKYYNSNGNITDSKKALSEVDNYTNELLNNKEIIEKTNDNNNISIKCRNGIRYVYEPQDDNLLASGDETTIITLQPYYEKERMKLDQIGSLIGHAGKLDRAASDISKRIYNTKNIDLNDTAASLDRIVSDFGPNMAIMIQTHGCCVGEKPYFLCGTDYNDSVFNKYKADFKDDSLIVRYAEGYNKVSVGGDFIQKYCKSMDNSIVYLGCCQSGNTSHLGNAFIAKGASAAIVNYNSIFKVYNINVMSEVLTQLSNRNVTGNFNSIGTALSIAKNKYGKTDQDKKSWQSHVPFAKEEESFPYIIGYKGARLFNVGDTDTNARLIAVPSYIAAIGFPDSYHVKFTPQGSKSEKDLGNISTIPFKSHLHGMEIETTVVPIENPKAGTYTFTGTNGMGMSFTGTVVVNESDIKPGKDFEKDLNLMDV